MPKKMVTKSDRRRRAGHLNEIYPSDHLHDNILGCYALIGAAALAGLIEPEARCRLLPCAQVALEGFALRIFQCDSCVALPGLQAC